MQTTDVWVGFLQQLTVAHETDLVELQNNVSAAATLAASAANTSRNDWNKGINAKDLKPHKFDSNVKSQQSYKQFAQDAAAWMKKIDKNLAEMLKATSQLEEWSDAKYVEIVKQNLGIAEVKIKELDDDMVDLLRNITEGDAREMVDAAGSGPEAWWRMSDRFYPKGCQGATATVDRIQKTARPANINDSYGKLIALKRLLKEFARQSPNEPLPSSVVKSAMIRVLPESYHKTLTHGLTIDKTTVTQLEDRVLQIITENTSGIVGMDLSELSAEKDREVHAPQDQPATAAGADQWGSQGTEGWWPSPSELQEGVGAYALQKGKGGKGKGKSEFQGYCDGCNGWGHTWRYCPNKDKGKSKGKGKEQSKGWGGKSGKGKGDKGYGKGYGKGKGVYGFEMESFQGEHPKCISSKLTASQF